MKGAKTILTKFEVAERQLHQAILLFFGEGDAVSIHTLCETASQVFYDIGKSEGVGSILRDSDWIKDEYRKEWRQLLAKPRNFFKHADRDADEIIEFFPETNPFFLLDAATMASRLKPGWTPETHVLLSWISLKHPRLIKKGTDMEAKAKQALTGPFAINPEDLSTFAAVIHGLRTGQFPLPHIVLVLGRLEPAFKSPNP